LHAKKERNEKVRIIIAEESARKIKLESQYEDAIIV
jgi:hypothetical protein